ncbi:DNA alkylation repair protein [Nocardioides sp. Bht2]|uniref:DNA alkylation repair protein n=1 Tax=Nocardioides sp. Bht2 TaxID=3392297 RepID=UPI0039B3ECF0
MPTSTADDVRAALALRADPYYAAQLARFFQTHPGGYGEGDLFIGVRVPAVRAVAKEHRGLALAEVRDLLDDDEHEHRLAALVLAVDAFRRALKPRSNDAALREELHALYLDAVYAGCVNNWDLVDVSSEWLVGEHLRTTGAGTALIRDLVAEEDLWRRRVGIIATFAQIKAGQAQPTFDVAAMVLADRRDLIQKASGWMVREVGKRIDRAVMVDFLTEHASRMGRTALSYAVEHLDPELRAHLRAL